jgi:hypothetical protein
LKWHQTHVSRQFFSFLTAILRKSPNWFWYIITIFTPEKFLFRELKLIVIWLKKFEKLEQAIIYKIKYPHNTDKHSQNISQVNITEVNLSWQGSRSMQPDVNLQAEEVLLVCRFHMHAFQVSTWMVAATVTLRSWVTDCVISLITLYDIIFWYKHNNDHNVSVEESFFF